MEAAGSPFPSSVSDCGYRWRCAVLMAIYACVATLEPGFFLNVGGYPEEAEHPTTRRSPFKGVDNSTLPAAGLSPKVSFEVDLDASSLVTRPVAHLLQDRVVKLVREGSGWSLWWPPTAGLVRLPFGCDSDGCTCQGAIVWQPHKDAWQGRSVAPHLHSAGAALHGGLVAPPDRIAVHRRSCGCWRHVTVELCRHSPQTVRCAASLPYAFSEYPLDILTAGGRWQLQCCAAPVSAICQSTARLPDDACG